MTPRRFRHVRQRLAFGLLFLGFALALVPLVWVIGSVLRLGLPGLDPEFLLTPMSGGGTAGGVAGQIQGTLILLATAFVLCAPCALATALWIGALAPAGGRVRVVGEHGLHILNAMPSILFGLFVMFVWVRTWGFGKSWLAGGAALAMMMLPTTTLAVLERFRSTPGEQLDAAAGLGFSRARVVTAVMLPRAWIGLVTGSLLGLARAAGETAPILFTAVIFSGAGFPDGVRESPVLALPYHIFVMAQDVHHPDAAARIWSSALLLVLIGSLLSLAVFPLRLRLYASNPGF